MESARENVQTGSAARPPVEVLHVPPPVRKLTAVLKIVLAEIGAGYAIILPSLALVYLGFVSYVPGGLANLGPFLGQLLAVVAPALAVLLATPLAVGTGILGDMWLGNRAACRCRERMRAAHPEVDTDPRLAALSEAWGTARRRDLRPLARVLQAPRYARSTTPIVCLGEVDVPPATGALAEPIVITPSRTMRAILWLVVAFFASYCVFLGGMKIVPRPIGLGVPLLVALIAVVVWVWLVLLRPRYVRFAPGVMQVLTYGPFRPQPRITSFPFDGGTQVFIAVQSLRKRDRTRLEFAAWRGGHIERVRVVSMSREELEALWRVLLCTAPTPPLSNTELSG
jgi:hypothetical protein